MYVDRRSDEFIEGLRYFLCVAEKNKEEGFMCCLCVVCRNQKDYSRTTTLHAHLLQSGFMPIYNCWTKHGERGVMMEDNEEEEEDDDMYPNYDDTATGHDEMAFRTPPQPL